MTINKAADLPTTARPLDGLVNGRARRGGCFWSCSGSLYRAHPVDQKITVQEQA